MIEDLTIIVIARNEAFGLKKCLQSIGRLKLKNCQVICVDSGSTDETPELMREFLKVLPFMHAFSIRGYSNAAIARNVGIENTLRENVFFVDGDVEIDGGFITVGINCLKNGVDCVTGGLREFQYTRGFEEIRKVIDDRFYIKAAERIYASGGCFLTRKSVVDEVGFFDERLERSQDYDYTLRITKRHIMKAIPYNMGIHHTIGYDDRGQMRAHLNKLHAVFLGNVMRNNLHNIRGIAWLFLKRERGIAFGGVLLVMGIICSITFGLPVVLLLLGAVILDVLCGMVKRDKTLYRFYLHYVFPILAFIGLFHVIDRRAKRDVSEIT